MSESPELLTVAEAAPRLRISRRQAYYLIERGEFPVPVLTIGTRIRIPAARLDEFVAALGTPVRAAS